MPHPVRRILVALVALVVLVAFSGPCAGVAGAHTEVQRSEPGPGARVDGVVDAVELVFLDPVRRPVEIVVSSLDGDPVAGLEPTTLSDDGRTARVGFDPLADSGSVLVEYRFVAEDGASQSGSYSFRVLGAPASPSDDPSGVGTTRVAALIGLVALVAAAGSIARLRARQRAAPTAP